MTAVAPTSRNGVVVQPAGTAQKALGQSDFLRLMTTQLREQDPFNPVDNQQMVAQMAQFSSLSGINDLNVTLKGIATQLAEQTAILTEIRARSGTDPTPAQGA